MVATWCFGRSGCWWRKQLRPNPFYTWWKSNRCIMNKLGSVKVRQENGRRMVSYNHITLVKPHNEVWTGSEVGYGSWWYQEPCNSNSNPRYRQKCLLYKFAFVCLYDSRRSRHFRKDGERGNATLAQTNLTGEKWVTNMIWMVRKARVVCFFAFMRSRGGWLQEDCLGRRPPPLQRRQVAFELDRGCCEYGITWPAKIQIFNNIDKIHIWFITRWISP